MILAVALTLVGLLQEPQKGASIEEIFARPGEFFMMGDVVVATVKKVSDPPATNGNPPRVELEIHEVLRGEATADRTRALWKPFPHDVDWVGAGAEERLGAWEARPMTLPKAGDKMLLSGAIEPTSKLFEVWSSGRVPFTAEKRAWAVAEIRRHAEIRRKTQEENARAQRERAEAVARWRAKVSAKDIADYVAKADFVGVGRIVSGSAGAPTYDITEILKGVQRKQFQEGHYYVKTDLPGELPAYIGNREYTCIVFLTEQDLDLRGISPLYRRIDLGDGIVIADEESLRAARAAAKK